MNYRAAALILGIIGLQCRESVAGASAQSTCKPVLPSPGTGCMTTKNITSFATLIEQFAAADSKSLANLAPYGLGATLLEPLLSKPVRDTLISSMKSFAAKHQVPVFQVCSVRMSGTELHNNSQVPPGCEGMALNRNGMYDVLSFNISGAPFQDVVLGLNRPVSGCAMMSTCLQNNTRVANVGFKLSPALIEILLAKNATKAIMSTFGISDEFGFGLRTENSKGIVFALSPEGHLTLNAKLNETGSLFVGLEIESSEGELVNLFGKNFGDPRALGIYLKGQAMLQPTSYKATTALLKDVASVIQKPGKDNLPSVINGQMDNLSLVMENATFSSSLHLKTASSHLFSDASIPDTPVHVYKSFSQTGEEFVRIRAPKTNRLTLRPRARDAVASLAKALILDVTPVVNKAFNSGTNSSVDYATLLLKDLTNLTSTATFELDFHQNATIRIALAKPSGSQVECYILDTIRGGSCKYTHRNSTKMIAYSFDVTNNAWVAQATQVHSTSPLVGTALPSSNEVYAVVDPEWTMGPNATGALFTGKNVQTTARVISGTKDYQGFLTEWAEDNKNYPFCGSMPAPNGRACGFRQVTGWMQCHNKTHQEYCKGMPTEEQRVVYCPQYRTPSCYVAKLCDVVHEC
mmetsp:Transcript_1424/g.2193  ORF Transcript_1424/g.2193 Transcript_1424/m.2193 type:complete len:634 (+) Transcript_1424:368-2269(+)